MGHRPDLANLEGSGDLTIVHDMANSPYIQNLGSVSHPHALEETLVSDTPNWGEIHATLIKPFGASHPRSRSPFGCSV